MKKIFIAFFLSFVLVLIFNRPANAVTLLSDTFNGAAGQTVSQYDPHYYLPSGYYTNNNANMVLVNGGGIKIGPSSIPSGAFNTDMSQFDLPDYYCVGATFTRNAPDNQAQIQLHLHNQQRTFGQEGVRGIFDFHFDSATVNVVMFYASGDPNNNTILVPSQPFPFDNSANTHSVKTCSIDGVVTNYVDGIQMQSANYNAVLSGNPTLAFDHATNSVINSFEISTPDIAPTPQPIVTPTPAARSKSNGTWTSVGSMANRRIVFSSTLLQDGKVLIAGGRPSLSESLILSTELYDPVTQTWSSTGNLNTPRESSVDIPESILVTLQNGKALIVGGADTDATAIDSVELYDPATGQWTPTGSLNTARRDAGIVLLHDGRVLAAAGVTGPISGTILTTAELYDPETGQWSYTANNLGVHRDAAKAIVLPSGKVLLISGHVASGANEHSAEIFDPATNRWSFGGTMPFGADHIRAVVLPDGRVFAVGRNSNDASKNAAIYNPSTNKWTSVAAMPINSSPAGALLLDNGSVLVRTGDADIANSVVHQVYNPSTNSWTVINLTSDAIYGSFTQLTNGDILMAGGIKGVSSCDLNNPSCTLASAELFTAVNSSPVVNPISVSINPVEVNNATSATADFTDQDTSDTHTATIDWGDGTSSSCPANSSQCTITESNGSGTVIGTHSYAQAGVYTITLTVSDGNGGTTIQTFKYLSVYNPTSQGLFSAGSRYISPAGAYAANTNLTGDVKFGLSYKYEGTVPVGNRQFTMDFKAANFTFNAATISSLVIANGIGTLTGTGTFNGSGNYTFLVSGSENEKTIRIQIKDASNNVIYDTQPGEVDTALPTTPVTGNVLAH